LSLDPVREERIALLDHHSSQMQSYKIYALSLIAGFFGVVQSLPMFRLATQVAITLVWLAMGFVAGGLFFCLGRFMWYGTMVTQTINTEIVTDPKSDYPPMFQLERCIGQNALAVAQGESPRGKETNRIVRCLIRLGHDRLALVACSFGILAALIAIRLLDLLRTL
jgi:hypothetical protein